MNRWTPLLFLLLLSPIPLLIDISSFRVHVDQQEEQQGSCGHVRVPEPKRYKVYYNEDHFHQDYKQMLRSFKVFVYPDAFNQNRQFSNVFLPHANPYDRKLGNYFSEHMFKINLLSSYFLTSNPAEAHLFFMPFSVNVMRNDPRIHSEASMASFVGSYVEEIRSQYRFWNRTEGADHFYVACHSAGREIALHSKALQQNSIQVTCSANYYHKFYLPHKDVPLPQVWPRASVAIVVPPCNRTRLAFFSGRAQNSRVREALLKLWSNDSDMDIHGGTFYDSYEKAFSTTKYCLHVKGYEVNTARISDAIHFGCVPVIISNHYDLPLSNIIDWRSFSVILSYAELPSLKTRLQNISPTEYARLHANVRRVSRHFGWHTSPEKYDSFYMTMYQLWLRRHIVRPPL